MKKSSKPPTALKLGSAVDDAADGKNRLQRYSIISRFLPASEGPDVKPPGAGTKCPEKNEQTRFVSWVFQGTAVRTFVA